MKFKQGLVPPLLNPVVTSPYGWRVLNGQKQFHEGIDFINAGQDASDRLNPKNTEVFSIGAGVVCFDFDNYEDRFRFDGTHKQDSAGNMVIIDTEIEGIRYFVRYLHLIRNNVSQDQHVVTGQYIGDYADVGFSYGAHLHLDMYTHGWSKKVDPNLIII